MAYTKQHFLSKVLTEIGIVKADEPTGFSAHLSEKRIPVKEGAGGHPCRIEWEKSAHHWQFPFDGLNNEKEIRNWLSLSVLNEYEMLETWMGDGEPIITVKSREFIKHWEHFNIAGNWNGITLCTPDGKYFIEFVHDDKYYINSNFEIKPGTRMRSSE